MSSGADVYSAKLNVYYYYHISTGNLTAGAYRILEDWDESTITYSNAPSVSTTRNASATLSASSSTTESNPAKASFDITTVVTNRYENGADYFGVAIKRESGTNVSVILKAVESYNAQATTNYYPYININYTFHIPDGVYAIQNRFGKSWITIENDSSFAGSHVQYMDSDDSPANANVFDRSCLFKITRVGSTNRYTIRSMLNNNLSFGISGTEIITKMIPSDDAAVASADTFNIEWDGMGFLIRPYGTSVVIAMPSLSGVINLRSIPKGSDNLASGWNLVQYTGAHKTGFSRFFPSSWNSIGMVVGETDQMTLFGWSTYTYGNTPFIEVAPGYEALGTSSWNATANVATLTFLSPGEIRLKVYIRNTNQANLYAGFYNHRVVPQEGMYYVRNAGSQRYMDLESASTAVGAIIQQWDFHTGSQAKWMIEHVTGSGGYVRIKSVRSNLYVGVDSSNTALIKQYSAQNNYTLWKIGRSTAGNLKLTCKATESGGSVLSIPLSADNNGTDLTQIAYTDDTNYRDEWKIYKCNYALTVNHYYDQGYVARFPNALSNMQSYQNVCSRILLELFGLDVSATYSSFTSSADTCTGTPVTLADTVDGCNHSGTDHKTRNCIKDDIVSQFGSGNNTTAKIVWTGHVLESGSSCSYADEHIILIANGTVTDSSNNNRTDDVIRYQRIYDMLHEISHQFGAPDHYCYDVDSENCNNPTNDCYRCDRNLTVEPDCVMTARKYDLESRLNNGDVDTIYCSQCMSSTHAKGILTHLNDHHD